MRCLFFCFFWGGAGSCTSLPPLFLPLPICDYLFWVEVLKHLLNIELAGWASGWSLLVEPKINRKTSLWKEKRTVVASLMAAVWMLLMWGRSEPTIKIRASLRNTPPGSGKLPPDRKTVTKYLTCDEATTGPEVWNGKNNKSRRRWIHWKLLRPSLYINQ